MMQRRQLLLVLGLSPLAACNRWRPATPRRVYFQDAVVAYDVAKETLHRLGYDVGRADPARYNILVVAKIDQGRKLRSHILLQAFANGIVEITAHGDHVRPSEGRMHRKLSKEVDDITHALYASGQAVR